MCSLSQGYSVFHSIHVSAVLFSPLSVGCQREGGSDVESRTRQLLLYEHSGILTALSCSVWGSLAFIVSNRFTYDTIITCFSNIKTIVSPCSIPLWVVCSSTYCVPTDRESLKLKCHFYWAYHSAKEQEHCPLRSHTHVFAVHSLYSHISNVYSGTCSCVHTPTMQLR